MSFIVTEANKQKVMDKDFNMALTNLKKHLKMKNSENVLKKLVSGSKI